MDYEGNAVLPDIMNTEQLMRLVDDEPRSVEREREQGEHATTGFAQSVHTATFVSRVLPFFLAETLGVLKSRDAHDLQQS